METKLILCLALQEIYCAVELYLLKIVTPLIPGAP